MMFNSKMTNGIEDYSKLIIVSISIILWILIINHWKKEEKTIANNH